MKFEHYLHDGSEEEDFLSVFEKSKMAAKSWDLDQSNYVKNLPMTWGIFSQSFMILAQIVFELCAFLRGGKIIIIITIINIAVGDSDAGLRGSGVSA